MAEEYLDPLITPEKTSFISKHTCKSSAGNPGFLNRQCCSHVPHRRASIAAYHIRDNPRKWDNARRYSSVVKPDSASISQIIVPHYLRASTGSCHDICKYGRRHVCEEKPLKPLDESTSSGKQKKEKVVKNEPSLDAKKCSLVLKPFIVSKYYSPPKLKPSLGEKTYTLTRQNVVFKKPFVVSKCYSPELKTPSCDKTYTPRQNVVLKPFVVSKTYTPKRNVSSSSNKNRFLPNSTRKKSGSSYPPEIIKREILSKGDSIDNKMSKIDKRTFYQPVKRSCSVKSKPVKAKPRSDGIHGKGGRKNDVKNGRKMTSPTLSAKTPLVPPVALLPPKFPQSKTALSQSRKGGPHKMLPPMKGRNGIRWVETGRSNGEDSVKTLYVIKNGAEKSPSLSHEEHDEKMKSSGTEADEFVSDKTVSGEIGEVQLVKENHKGTDKNALQRIPDNRAKSSSSLYHEESDKVMKNSGKEADEYDNTVPVEIGEVQPVKQNHNKTKEMRTENKNGVDSISDDHAKSPSLLSHGDDKEIKYNGNIAAGEFVSGNTVSVEIGKVKPVNAESPSLLSHEVDGEEIKIKHSDNEADNFVSGNTVPVNITKVQPVKENHDKTLRKSKTVISEDKYSPPVKLKFRRGKIIELHPDNNNIPRKLRFRRSARVNSTTEDDLAPDSRKSTVSRKSRVVVPQDKYTSPMKLVRSTERFVHLQADNSTPRKLRFRRARVLVAENGKYDDFRRRSFKRSGSKDDLAGAEFSSRRVILKHRNLQWKNDNDRVLYNNVIEETASKLVESRKSKVKALVGAFETVISLQERQP